VCAGCSAQDFMGKGWRADLDGARIRFASLGSCGIVYFCPLFHGRARYPW
jgi:hypothetical protein